MNLGLSEQAVDTQGRVMEQIIIDVASRTPDKCFRGWRRRTEAGQVVFEVQLVADGFAISTEKPVVRADDDLWAELEEFSRESNLDLSPPTPMPTVH